MAQQGKIDKIYQNKPRLFKMNNNQNNPATMNNNYMISYPPPFMNNQYMPYPNQYIPSDFQCPPQFLQTNNPPNRQMAHPMNSIQEKSEKTGSKQYNQSDFDEQKYFEQNKSVKSDIPFQFDLKNMPPLHAPPPEMIQALAQLMQQGQNNIPPPQQTIPAYSQIPSMLPQSLVRSNQRIKLTSHIYKNQNAPDTPLNPQFIQSTKRPKVSEKLYQPNAGYVIDEEDELLKKQNKERKFVRGQDDLIQSGVTTEKDEDSQYGDITQGEREFINQKFLLSESITESQFKGQIPNLYIDPVRACKIEEQKFEEQENYEDEFQMKKEVFLVKNKYKILNDLEQEKSRKLMERVLKQEMDEIEKKNRGQEILAQLEGEQIRNQKKFAKDLERIISEIREEKDHQTIKNVLGINIDKPIDEIIDLEKIKADFALEQMYKRNQELYDQANDLFQECNYYVDDEGNHHNIFNELKKYDKEYEIEKYLKKKYNLEDEDDDDTDEEEHDYQNNNKSHNNKIDNKKLGLSKNSSMLAQSIMAESQIMSGSTNLNQSQRIRFEKRKQTWTPEQQNQRDFYKDIRKKLNDTAEQNEQDGYEPKIKISDLNKTRVQKQQYNQTRKISTDNKTKQIKQKDLNKTLKKGPPHK